MELLKGRTLESAEFIATVESEKAAILLIIDQLKQDKTLPSKLFCRRMDGGALEVDYLNPVMCYYIV